MKNETKKVAIITSGGDAPGMNLAIRNLIETLSNQNIEVYLGFEGYKGLFENKIFGPFVVKDFGETKMVVNWDKEDIRIKYNQFEQSGSYILSSRFKKLAVDDNDTIQIKNNLLSKDISDLIVIGGDGSMMGAQVLSKIGINTFVIPATIDNDFLNSSATIGAYSAANMNRLIIDALIATSKTHKAIHILEVMGRGSSWLTKASVGYLNILATITNETKKYTPQEVFALIQDKIKANENSINGSKYEPLIAVQELIYDDNWYNALIMLIKNNTSYNARFSKIGYIQRGAFVTNKENKLVNEFCKHLTDFYLSSHHLEGQYVVVKNEDATFSVIKTI